MRNYIKENNLPGIVVLILDLFVVAGALFFAFLLRFNFKIPADQLVSIPRILLCVIICHLISFGVTQTYKSIIRYTATKDISRIFLANGITSFSFVLINIINFYFIDRTFFIPFSIIILEFIISTFVIWFYRMGIKVAYLEFVNPTREKQNVIIYGAGNAGLNSKRAIDRDAGLKYKVFAFVDDDPSKSDKKLEGVSIYFSSKLEEIMANNTIAHVIIAIQNIHPD